MDRMKSLRAKLAFSAFLLLVSVSLVFGGGPKDSSATAAELYKGAKAKYVFLFIGDGMAAPQVNAAEIYKSATSNAGLTVTKLAFTQFPVSGLTTTYDASSFITDSASAMTAMMSGHKTLSGVINMDPKKEVKYRTLAEYAKQAGMKVGVVSSVSLDHATPAGTYAKVASRGDMYGICLQLAASNFDYFGGGGLEQSGRKEGQADAKEVARQNGYTVVTSTDAFKALKPGAGKVLAMNAVLQDANAMPYEMDRASNDLNLADYTQKGIELLDGPKGFFMMVEGGKIDWACHANDGAASIKDTLALDASVGEALKFAEKHPKDTLIVVTGDHETGGMSIGFSGTKYSTFFETISLQKDSFTAFNQNFLAPYKKNHTKATANFEEVIPVFEQYFGLQYAGLSVVEKELLQRAFARSMENEVERAAQEDVYLLYGGYEPITIALTHIFNQRAGIGWTTYSHTGVPVITFAKGVGQNLFGGYYDNTDIFQKLAAVMGIKVPQAAASK